MPIISPWIIYFVSKIDILIGLCQFLAAAAGCFTLFYGVVYISVNVNSYRDSSILSKVKKDLRKGLAATMVFLIAACAIPNKQETAAIILANYATYENVEYISQSVGNTVDDFYNKILQLMEVSNEETK